MPDRKYPRPSPAPGRSTVAKPMKRRRRSSDEVAAIRFLAASLITLSNLFRRESALTIQRLFGLPQVEGHVVGYLGFESHLSLDILSDRIGLAKSQMSRSVANLVAHDLVKREDSSTDGREIKLSLTSRGRELHAAFLRNTRKKNRSFTAGINPNDLEHLKRLIGHLTVNMRKMLQQEQRLAGSSIEADRETLGARKAGVRRIRRRTSPLRMARSKRANQNASR